MGVFAARELSSATCSQRLYSTDADRDAKNDSSQPSCEHTASACSKCATVADDSSRAAKTPISPLLFWAHAAISFFLSSANCAHAETRFSHSTRSRLLRAAAWLLCNTCASA